MINVTVDAATDHEIAGSSAFPNFTHGAVDNYYSLAHSGIDNSPSAEGTASPADTGPLGQTIAAGNFSQPQYADARWPGNSGKQTVGNQGGPYAEADAGAFKATATSSEASGQSSSSGSAHSGRSGKSRSAKALKIAAPKGAKGFSRRLHRALTAWKATWLPRLHLTLPGLKTPSVKLKLRSLTAYTPQVTVPSVSVPGVTAPTVTTPGATSGNKTHTGHKKSHHKKKKKKGSAPPPASSKGDGQALLQSTTSAGFDPTNAMVTTGESSLGTVSIGNGQIVLQGIDVSVAVSNNGTPSDKIAVDVANASVGGVPVTIDQDGVHIAGQSGPLPFGQADDALNSALKQAGVQLYTVNPEIKKSPNELSITATGVHVAFAQPVSPSGVPAQFAEHILGEVYVDSLAVPGTPLGSLSNLGLGSSSSLAGGGSSSFTGGSSSSLGSSGTGYSSSSPVGSTSSASQPASSLLSSVTSRPLWFLLLYFLWQSVMVGTGASIWYWRIGGAR